MKDVDPVEELHKIRREICKKAGGTPADYFRYYLELDKKNAAANKAVEAANPGKQKTLQSKPRRKSAKPSARKPGQRRKAIAP